MSGEPDLACATVVDPVDGLHQAIGGVDNGRMFKQAVLHLPLRRKIAEHNAGLGVARPIPPDAFEQGGCLPHQLPGIGGRLSQTAGGGITVIGVTLIEGAGTDKNGKNLRPLLVVTQFFGSAGGKFANRLPDAVFSSDLLTKGARADNLFFRWRDLFQADTGFTVKFPERTLHNDRILPPDAAGVHTRQLPRRRDAEPRQTLRVAATDPPDFGDRSYLQQALLALRIRQIDHAAGLFEFFGGIIGEFGQSLGRSDTDTDRNPNLPADVLPDLPAVSSQLGKTGQIKESLVNGIDFNPWGKGFQGLHHPGRDIVVEAVIT